MKNLPLAALAGLLAVMVVLAGVPRVEASATVEGYKAVWVQNDVPPGAGLVEITADCGAEYVILGGGHLLLPYGAQGYADLQVLGSHPQDASSPYYRFRAINHSTFPGTVRVFATCALR